MTLYATDGTTPGTAVRHLTNGQYATDFRPGEHIGFFGLYNGGDAPELWQTDGSAAGTHAVRNETPIAEGSVPESLTSANGRLYFVADDGKGPQLFAAADPAPPKAVVDCRSARCGNVQTVDGRLAFTRNSEWWTIADDGTALPVKSWFGLAGDVSTPPVHLGDADYTLALNGTTWQLWARRGGRGSVVGNVNFRYAGNANLRSNGTRLFFSNGDALWTSDGTAQGTVPLTSGAVQGFYAAAGGVYFGYHDAGQRQQFWFSDGTAAGAHALRSPAPDRDLAANFAVTWRAMLVYEDSYTGSTWRSDGTADGTVQLPITGTVRYAADLGDRLAIITQNASNSTVDVWTTDGTPENTVHAFNFTGVFTVLSPVRLANGDVYLPLELNRPTFVNLRSGKRFDVNAPFAPAFDDLVGGEIAAFGNRIVFAAETLRNGQELWAVDVDGGGAPLPSFGVTFAGLTVMNGKRAALFRVTIDGGSATPSAVRLATADGTLKAGRDYTATADALQFTIDDVERTVAVPVGDDGGTFSVVLSQPDNATIANGFATADIPAASQRRRVAH
jgi:ELWxxDGT repeat protein